MMLDSGGSLFAIRFHSLSFYSFPLFVQPSFIHCQLSFNPHTKPMHSESTLLVRPEHLNHHGYLFGGRLLEWLDEQAYIAAMSRLNSEANLVTIAIDRVQFQHSVVQRSLPRFPSILVHSAT